MDREKWTKDDILMKAGTSPNIISGILSSSEAIELRII